MKGAIFDKDGTLFDSEKYYNEGWYVMAERMGFEVTQAFIDAIWGRSGQDQIDRIHAMKPEIDAYAYWKGYTDYAVEKMRETLELKPGVIEILEYLKTRGIPCAIASGGSTSLIRENLEKAGLTAYFSGIASAVEVPHSKPHPDVFYEACRQLKLSPEDCMVFEDSTNGILGACAAGCKAVLIPETDTIDPCLEGKCEVFKDFFEVIEWLKTQE